MKPSVHLTYVAAGLASSNSPTAQGTSGAWAARCGAACAGLVCESLVRQRGRHDVSPQAFPAAASTIHAARGRLGLSGAEGPSFLPIVGQRAARMPGLRRARVQPAAHATPPCSQKPARLVADPPARTKLMKQRSML